MFELRLLAMAVFFAVVFLCIAMHYEKKVYKRSLEEMYRQFPFSNALVTRGDVYWRVSRFSHRFKARRSTEDPNFHQRSLSESECVYADYWFIVTQSGDLFKVPLGECVSAHLTLDYKYVVWLALKRSSDPASDWSKLDFFSP